MQLTPCMKMSVALHPPRRMGYEHSWVRHSLDVSLMKLHMTKPTQGTHGLNPTPAYFDIVSGHMLRTKSQKIEFISGHYLIMIFIPSHSAYAQILFCYTEEGCHFYMIVRINWSIKLLGFFVGFSRKVGCTNIRNSVVCYHTLYLPLWICPFDHVKIGRRRKESKW